MRRKNLGAPQAIRRRLPLRELRRNTKLRSGAELLELGLVLGTILLPVMFGIIEFGTYFYVEHNLQAAAREGARAACVHNALDWNGANTDASNAIQAELSSSSIWNWGNFKSNFSFLLSQDDDPNHTGQKLWKVTVSITWDKIPAGMRPMRMIRNPQNVTLTGVAVMRAES
jgi:TadE-like protein